MPVKFRPLSDLQDVKQGQGLVTLAGKRGAARGGAVELAPLADGVWRVRISPRSRLAPYQSLAVVAQEAAALTYQCEATEAAVRVQAEEGAVVAQQTPLALSFTRADGAVIAADITAGGLGDRIVVRKRLHPGEVIYGLGEKTGWLDKRGRRYRMENTDVFLKQWGIGNTTDPMYASYPVFIVHSAAGSYGIFVDNPEFTEFDFRQPESYEFSAPARTLTYYVLPGPALPDVLRQYTGLTGRMPIPALWTLGYHQCRWGYKSEADVREVAAQLRQRQIPADAIWCDIDYMDGYRVFTWDGKRFPRPARLTKELAAEGLRTVTIIDPGVKVDPHYSVYREGHRQGYFIRHVGGKEYNGRVWPGRSAFPDFHAPAAAAWWADNVQRWQDDYGIAGIWIDMNEPATTDMSGPIDDVQHANGRLPHASARNTYALQMARATYAACCSTTPTRARSFSPARLSAARRR